MQMHRFLIIVAIFFALPTYAADRGEKIRLLMHAQGLFESYEQQRSSGEIRMQRELKKLTDQEMSNLDPSPEYLKLFNDVGDKYIKSIQYPWTAKDKVDAWVKYYGEKFSDEEIDQLLAFYTSPIGQKEVMIVQEESVKISKHFQDIFVAALERAFNEYLNRMKVLIKECNCSKKS
jgi:hypothetical protein